MSAAQGPASGAPMRVAGWPLRWKVFSAFVLISLVAPLLAGVLGQRLFLHTLETETHNRLAITARGIAGQLATAEAAQGSGNSGSTVAAARSHLRDVVQVAAEATGAVVAITGPDGEIFMSIPQRAIVEATMGPSIQQVLQGERLQCTMPSRRCGLPAPFSEATVLGGYPVRVGGRIVGAVVLARPVRELRASALFEQKLFWQSWAVGIALSLLLGLALAGGITRPLRAMAVAAEGISRGDFHHRVPQGAGDEIGLLAHAFNRMGERLDRVLSARRELLAAVSHELRTPLTSIQGFVQALRDGLVAADATERTYDIIEGEIARLRRLIEDLFELSKLEAGQAPLRLQPTSAAELVEAAAGRARALSGRDGPEVETLVAPDAGLLTADPDRIFQVLGNLVQNALRFTPAEGSITLRAEGRAGPDGRLPVRDAEEVTFAPSAVDRVRFEVQDTGAGIAPEDVEHVFERFYTADRSRSRPVAGTGLGLAIAREIVRAHGGTIGCDSVVGHGSRFWFELPRLGSADPAPGAAGGGLSRARRRPARSDISPQGPS